MTLVQWNRAPGVAGPVHQVGGGVGTHTACHLSIPGGAAGGAGGGAGGGALGRRARAQRQVVRQPGTLTAETPGACAECVAVLAAPLRGRGRGRRPGQSTAGVVSPGRGRQLAAALRAARAPLTHDEITAAVRAFQQRGGLIQRLPFSDLELRVAGALFRNQGGAQ